MTRYWNKQLPNFPQKVATFFLHNSDIIWNSPKIHQNIWATFVRQFVAKKLLKIAQSGHSAPFPHETANEYLTTTTLATCPNNGMRGVCSRKTCRKGESREVKCNSIVVTVFKHTWRVRGRHSSVDSTTTTILRSWVQIPSTPSLLFYSQTLYYICHRIETRMKINK